MDGSDAKLETAQVQTYEHWHEADWRERRHLIRAAADAPGEEGPA